MRLGGFALAASAALALGFGDMAHAEPLALEPGQFPLIGETDARFQSFNVEMAEIIGGRFWRPYAENAEDEAPPPAAAEQVGVDPNLYAERPPIDLANARLRTLASALGPFYMRVSGSWANTVYFQDDDAPPLQEAPEGFQNVLTRAQWRSVVEFAEAIDAKLVISFAINAPVRDAEGVWTPVQARPLMQYTHDIGGEVYAAELFNEPNFSARAGGPENYDGPAFARDIEAFRAFAADAAPNMLIVGPGDTTVPGIARGPTTRDFLAAEPRPHFDVFSYHFYPSISQRCAPPTSSVGITPERAMTEEWLARTDAAIQARLPLRDAYAPHAPIWLTEVAGAACGGAPHSATFVDTFRYLDQAGRLAKQGVSAIFHNTLSASEYGVIDEHSWTPRPNYWAALLWRRLMGTRVLDAGEARPGLHVYAHCQRDQSGGVSMLAINLGETEATLTTSGPADIYLLSATALESTELMLNGETLALRDDGALPELHPRHAPDGTVTLPPKTIAFVATPDAHNAQCI